LTCFREYADQCVHLYSAGQGDIDDLGTGPNHRLFSIAAVPGRAMKSVVSLRVPPSGRDAVIMVHATVYRTKTFTHGLIPSVALVWADGGYANKIDNTMMSWAKTNKALPRVSVVRPARCR
jgi:hypothetical protein